VRRRLLPLAVFAAALVLRATLVSASPGTLPRAGVPWFLAVGDSITYGYSIDPAVQGNPSWAGMLRDSLAAQGNSLALYSAACPGETTTSYHDGGCVGRDMVPALGGRPQREAALSAIAQRGDRLRFIIVELGINDYFAARSRDGNIVVQLDAAVGRLDALVAELQRAAPGVPVILANIYDPHGLPDSATQAAYLDSAIATLAAQRHAVVADFLGAVRPHRCALLDCAHHDIHPTVAGQRALAAAVLDALQRPQSR
jgi:lysophospholipase L1-like esterase